MFRSLRARTGLAAAVLCAAHLARAADGVDAAEAIERAVSDNPRLVLREAAESERKALAAGDRPALLRALRLSSAASLIVMENERAQEFVDRGLPLARALGDPEAVRAFLTAEATLATNRGRFDEALRLVDEAIAYARSHGLTSGRAKSLSAKADVCVGMMRLSEALTLLDEAYAVFEKEGDRFWISEVLSGRAQVHGRDPEDPAGPEKAARLHAQANAMLDPKKQRYSCAIDYVNLGGEYSRLGRQGTARDYLGRAVSLGRQLDDPMIVAHAKYRLGTVEAEEGHDEKAVALFEEALPVFARSLVNEMVFGTNLRMAGALARLGRGPESLRVLGQAEEAAGKIATPDVDIAVSEAGMKIHERLGDAVKALACAKRIREAERKEAEAANSELARELGLKFEVKQKDSENALLRAQARVAEVRRLALVLALALLALALTVAGFVILRQRRRQRRLVTLAMRDELTGLPNRRAIQEFARLQFDLRGRLQMELSIGILDIDHFKAFNDTFGHSTGDEVLVAFTRACRGQLRGTDSLGRYGGDEFLLVMPGVDASQISVLFGRLCEGVTGMDVPGLPADVKVRFSLGVAQAADDEEGLDELLARADRALYRAKESGRDRFVIAEAATPGRAA
jgi:diguanylate cyclase (GGDEF)-like protein